MPKEAQEIYTLADLRNWPAAAGAVRPPIRLAVIGDPVAHSKSPQMHNAALRACGIEAAYARLHIRAEELAEALRLLPACGFIGANITIPHKAAALMLVDEVQPRAHKAGGVNTVAVHGKKLSGFSTDGPGFVCAVREEFGLEVHHQRVLVLGAGGGAGRAIAVQCAAERCAGLVLANRTFARAAALAAELGENFRAVQAIEPAAFERQLPQIDLIVNATPLGMATASGELRASSPLPAELLQPHHFVYDTVYTAERTPLLLAAQAGGARGANGLSMLLHQGALSFEHWFGRPAPLDVMREALKQTQ